jgi:hypothetical protein
MHDPCTVAHEIRYPWRKYGRRGKSEWETNYRAPFITVWHVDPENSKGKIGCKSDDTCGWHTPPWTQDDDDRIRKLGRIEYSTIFSKQHAIAEKKDYAYVCYEPSSYDAIYWTWRAIKHHERDGTGWKYGKSLSAAELNYIFSLDSNPVDNLRLSVAGVKDAETCASFFITVYRCYLRFNRVWYKHPRWHFWHWRIQVHPWQQFRRWAFTRCEHCGKGFKYGEAPVSHGWQNHQPKFFRGEQGLFHSACSGASTRRMRP